MPQADSQPRELTGNILHYDMCNSGEMKLAALVWKHYFLQNKNLLTSWPQQMCELVTVVTSPPPLI